MTESDYINNLLNAFPYLLPEITLIAFACVVFLGGTLRQNRHLWAAVSLTALIIAGALFPFTAGDFKPNVFANPLVGDSLALFLRLLALAAGVVFTLFSWNEIEDRIAGEYYGCLLIVLAGLALTGSANDLVTLFLALELISIPTYVMLYLPKHDEAAQEAALKYFLLSIFSSALLLFGFSYLYGLTGSTNLSVLLHTLNGLDAHSSPPMLARVALVMVVAGLGFKIAAVPFHFYAPDVYQGTGTVMAALLAFIPKAAGFIALLRVLGFVLPDAIDDRNVRIGEALSNQVPILLWFLAAVTMFLGNLLALLQNNLKRIFAYSSIAHAGYMLIGLAAAPFLREISERQGAVIDGVAAVLFYLPAYGVMTVGAFAVLARLHSPARPVETIDDLAGLAKTHPVSALMLTIFLFSLIGIPFTAGFLGKLFIFLGAIGVSGGQEAGGQFDALNQIETIFRILALIGVVNAAIGAWYYLRLISVMYLRTAVKPVQRPASVPAVLAIAICATLTVGLSVRPVSTWLFRAADVAAGAKAPVASNVSQR